MSRFRIDGDDLRNGLNIISLTITGVSGVSRVLNLPVQKIVGEASVISCFLAAAILRNFVDMSLII